MTINQRVQEFNPGDLVVLFQMDLTSLGLGVFYFTSSAWEDQAIDFDSNTYTPIDIEAEGFEWSGRGPLPTPSLKIANTQNAISSQVQNNNDLLGVEVVRIRTFREYLDDGQNPDPNMIFTKDIYRIERKKSLNKVYIEFELSSAIDQTGAKLPARQALRSHCILIYRRWNGAAFDYSKAQCPYVGAASFNQLGESVSDANDKCGKQLSDCQLRFGEYAKLPFLAFPGIQPNGI